MPKSQDNNLQDSLGEFVTHESDISRGKEEESELRRPMHEANLVQYVNRIRSLNIVSLMRLLRYVSSQTWSQPPAR